MSFFALLAELALAVAKVLGLAQESAKTQNDMAAGAAMQRAQDGEDEARRIVNAARAGAKRLPDIPDPNDRDGGA